MKEVIKVLNDKIEFYKMHKTPDNSGEFNERIQELEVAILILENYKKRTVYKEKRTYRFIGL